MSSLPRIGAVFSQTEMGDDPGAVRAWVQAATELGYSHITVAPTWITRSKLSTAPP
jgi:hypothetical protein